MTAIEFNRQLISQRLPLKKFAYSLTMNSEEAQDLVQDTYVKAISYREKFIDATNLKAWLYTIMKNTFINNYRRRIKTRQVIQQPGDLLLTGRISCTAGSSADSVMNEKQIAKAINALEDEYKIPFTRYFDGYKYKEIADELNLPIGTVKSRIFLARKKLMLELRDFIHVN